MKKTHYDTLGVTRDAKPDDIKKAFRKRAKSCHPDHHDGNGSKEAEFKELATAYNVLSNTDARRHYDATGEEKTAAHTTTMRAYELLAMLFQNLYQQNGDKVFLVDIIAKMAEATHGMERDAKTTAGKLRKQNKILDKLMTRVKHKDGDQTILHSVLGKERQGNRQTMVKLRADMLVFRRVRVLLTDYSFEPDAPEPQAEAMWRTTLDGAYVTFNIDPAGS